MYRLQYRMRKSSNPLVASIQTLTCDFITKNQSNYIISYSKMDYYYDDDDIVDKPGLFIHLVQQRGFKMLEFTPTSKFTPIFNLTCDIFCYHNELELPTSCPECSAKVIQDNLFRDTYMEQFKTQVRFDFQTKTVTKMPVGKTNHKWQPMPEVPQFTVSHLKYLKGLENKELTEEEQFELQNLHKYKIMPQPKPYQSFLNQKEKYSTEFQLENEAYFVRPYFPDPMIEPVEHIPENLRYRLESESNEIDVGLPTMTENFTRDIIACKKLGLFVVVICLEQMTDVVLYVTELAGSDYVPTSENFKQFYMLNKIQINKHEKVQQNIEEEYIQKNDYNINISDEVIWVTINSYGEGRKDNCTRTLQIPNMIGCEISCYVKEEKKYEPGVLDKLYYLRWRETGWMVIVTSEKIFLFEKPYSNLIAEFDNDYYITKMMQMNHDEMKKQLKLLVCHKSAKPKSKYAIIVYSFMTKQWTFRFIELLETYHGIVGFSKWYLTTFVPHHRYPERIINKKFTYNNYS